MKEVSSIEVHPARVLSHLYAVLGKFKKQIVISRKFFVQWRSEYQTSRMLKYCLIAECFLSHDLNTVQILEAFGIVLVYKCHGCQRHFKACSLFMKYFREPERRNLFY